ncbi:MAG TPA: type II toxin-antitoxin system VapC family toxin [Thermomicrobiales bacterium]|jgi:tRNA(fMet)-specific endonuclease VapC|nr:type II toxin-antitoxin system VapC family toxin [Thermomicrobiales bacterium]
MVAYLLDTNHASPLVTRGHPLRQLVRDRAAAGDTFAICVPVLTETLFGISLLPRALQNRVEWTRFQPLLPCYSPDETDGAAAATLQLALRRQGRQLATVDALIAAVALRYDLTLLTTDRDFLPIPTLALENWL